MGEADSYTVSMGRDSQGDASLSASGVHQGDVAQLSAAYSAARGHQSASLGASGAIVVHGGGVNLRRAVGDTFALLQVDGAAGLGGNGYSVRADAQPYRANSLSLDSRTLSAALELEDGVKQVVPRRGAVVKAVFRRAAADAFNSACAAATAARRRLAPAWRMVPAGPWASWTRKAGHCSCSRSRKAC